MTAAARKTEADTTAALLGLANATKSKAADGSLDTGYNIARMGLQAAHAACVSLFMTTRMTAPVATVAYLWQHAYAHMCRILYP